MFEEMEWERQAVYLKKISHRRRRLHMRKYHPNTLTRGFPACKRRKKFLSRLLGSEGELLVSHIWLVFSLLLAGKCINVTLIPDSAGSATAFQVHRCVEVTTKYSSIECKMSWLKWTRCIRVYSGRNANISGAGTSSQRRQLNSRLFITGEYNMQLVSDFLIVY